MFNILHNTSSPPDLLENGLALYRHTIKKTFLLSLVTVVLFLFPLYWHLWSGHEHHFVINLAVILGCFFLSLIFTISLLFKLYCEYYGIKNTLPRVMAQAFYRLITLLLVAILYFTIVIAGTMLMIVPGIILSITLMFSFLLVINENKGVFQSLMTSHQLVWGHWWHTFIVMSVPLLLNLLILLCAFVVMMGVLAPLLASTAGWLYYVFGVQLILQTLLLPFSFCIALVLFNDLRMRHYQTRRPY